VRFFFQETDTPIAVFLVIYMAIVLVVLSTAAAVMPDRRTAACPSAFAEVATHAVDPICTAVVREGEK
jgi:hypothetical protein